MEKETFYTPTGERIQITYEKVFEKGQNHLIETGKTDVYEKIQSYKDECDIGLIISKLLAGDEVEQMRIAQADKSAQYGDGTLYNKSLNEVNEIIKTAENIVNSLTTEELEAVKKAINGKVEEATTPETKETTNTTEKGETNNE